MLTKKKKSLVGYLGRYWYENFNFKSMKGGFSPELDLSKRKVEIPDKKVRITIEQIGD